MAVLTRRAWRPPSPNHAADGHRAPARPTRRPRPVEAARRGARARLGTGELQRLRPVALARAEARWLAGRDAADRGRDRRSYSSSPPRSSTRGESASCACGAGAPGSSELPDAVVAASRSRSSSPASRSRRRGCGRELGCPYEAALALVDSEDEAASGAALAELQRLGAAAAAAIVARSLRRRGGARDLRHGPRAATRENPSGPDRARARGARAGRDGMRNAADRRAARRLVRKTVDHHVSAILAQARRQHPHRGGRRAARLGIIEK